MARARNRLPLLLLGVVPLATASIASYLQFLGKLNLPPWAHLLGNATLIGIAAGWALVLATRQEEKQESLLDELSQKLEGLHQGGDDSADAEDSMERLDDAVTRIRDKYLEARSAKWAAEKDLHATRAEVERQIAERTSSLAAREESVRLLLQSVPEAIYGIDTSGVCTFCNRACVKLLGYGREDELVGRPIQDLMPIPVQHTQKAAREEKPIHSEETFWRADGTLFPVEYWSFPIIKGSVVVGAVVTFIDITERKRSEVALFREKERAQVTLNSIADGVITTDAAGKVRYLNPAAETLLGWRNADAIDKPFAAVFGVLNPVDHTPVASLLSPQTLLNKQNGRHGSSLLVRRDKSRIFVEQSAAAIRDRDATIIGYIIVFRDVSETRRMARQLAYQATHDPLTGAINRREFELRIERVLKAAPDRRTDCAVCFVDLDQFKVVNDTCGHRAGDELLKQLTQLLRIHLRQRDTLARVGGDEFGLLLEACSLEDACRLAETIRKAVHKFRFAWDDKTFSLGASIGLVEIDAELGYTLVEILAAADSACYRAKESGRNRVEVHEPNDDELRQMQGQAHWASKIQEALEHDRFELYFQDIVDIQGAQTPARAGHVEILVRMLDRHGNIAVPGAFLPAAERYNVAQATDRWVVSKVFAWLAARRSASLPQLVSINLSGATLSDATFLDFVTRTCSETGVDPRRICFEIAEVAALSKLTHAITLTDKLSQLGIQFALDDFGSGLSSFAYLRQLPVEFVKIDGTCIKDVVADPVSRAMVRSINDIGHIMGKQTIAKYVENSEILRTLRDLGVDQAQGYGIAAPQPLQTFDEPLQPIASTA